MISITSLKQSPELKPELKALLASVWHPCYSEGYACGEFIVDENKILEERAAWQFLLQIENQVVGVGKSVPIEFHGALSSLPDSGWDWAIHQAFEYNNPNILCALSITIHPTFQRRGLANLLLDAMIQAAKQADLSHIVVPARPLLKNTYPDLTMEKYAQFVREDGLPQDPWLRFHVQNGATISHIASKSMQISAPISKWESWFARNLQQGTHTHVDLPGELYVESASGEGKYTEQNVWCIYPLE